MSEEGYGTRRMLALRKLTRAIADLLRGQLKDYLTTLAPLMRPKSVFGDYVDGIKDTYKTPDAAFQELQNAYASLATKKPFNLPTELKAPVEVTSGVPEITLLEYSHSAKTDRDSKAITVTSPLRWILTYTGFGPKRLQTLLAGRTVANEIQEYVLHTLMMHVVMSRQPGLAKILEGLHFTVSTARVPGCGELPFTFLTSSVPTVRPPDEVIIESTEISGSNDFEEVVNLSELAAMKDPFKEKLIELAKAHGETLG